MRTSIRALTALAAAALLVAGTQTREVAKPQLFLIHQEFVHLSKAVRYEELTREAVEALRRSGVDSVSFTTVSGPEMGYVYVIPIGEDFSGMDRFRDNWAAAVEKIGAEKWNRIASESDSTIEYRQTVHALLRLDLSYVPLEPRIEPREANFVRCAFYYAVPGKEMELENLARQYAALLRAKNIANGFGVYQMVTGSDLPLYVAVQTAKSELDYHREAERLRERLGPEGTALTQKAVALARRVEVKTGLMRPELSFPFAPPENPNQER